MRVSAHSGKSLEPSMAEPKNAKKRKKTYYQGPEAKRKKPLWKEDLCPGMTGILISTNDQEKLCVPEAYNLLNEYADQLYGPESEAKEECSGDNEAEDIATTLAQEVQRLRGSEQKPRRFQAISSGTKHVVFIRCSPPVDPVNLVHYILSDILKTKQNKSRFCQRFIPVSVVCHATVEDIRKKIPHILAPHFYQEDTLWKFAVVYKARNNNDVSREDIIKTLASLVTQNGDYSHTVDLSNPDLTIVVEIIKNNCCLSVVRDFGKLKRYNIHSIIEDSSQGEPAKTDLSTEVHKMQEGDREDKSQKKSSYSNVLSDTEAGVAVSSETGLKEDSPVWSLHKNSDRDASGKCEEQTKAEPATAD